MQNLHVKQEDKMTIQEIRLNLREIRYYYEHEKLFKTYSKTIPARYITEMVEKYNRVIENAPPRLYAVYVELYVNNNSQAALAEDWGFTNEYIRSLNKKLCIFLLDEFENTTK